MKVHGSFTRDVRLRTQLINPLELESPSKFIHYLITCYSTCACCTAWLGQSPHHSRCRAAPPCQGAGRDPHAQVKGQQPSASLQGPVTPTPIEGWVSPEPITQQPCINVCLLGHPENGVFNGWIQRFIQHHAKMVAAESRERHPQPHWGPPVPGLRLQGVGHHRVPGMPHTTTKRLFLQEEQI